MNWWERAANVLPPAINIAGLALLICLPFVIVSQVAGFVALAGVATISFVLSSGWTKPYKRRFYILGFCAALIVLTPLALVYPFLEGGFDDGPFRGQSFAGEPHKLTIDHSLPFRRGHLAVSNRRRHESPVILYKEGDTVAWAIEMDVGEFVNVYSLSKISIRPGVLRDRVDFVASWTYGDESGKAYIWKLGGFQRFWLSW